MTKTIVIGGKEMRMRASALTPRIYRREFNRDLVRDMSGFLKAFKDGASDDAVLDNLEVFENVAWILLREGGENVGTSPEEWLDSIDGIFSIYEVMPQIIELWIDNQKTTSESKNPAGHR